MLLRGIDEHGFVFFTNRGSRKGRHLAANPRAAFTVLWRELDRQICVTGTSRRIDDEESDAYFATRPREAQLGAWASAPERRSFPSRADLERGSRRSPLAIRGDDVPRPPFWGGYRVEPDTIEFWQGRAHRLHDRFRYAREAGEPTGWRVERLSP